MALLSMGKLCLGFRTFQNLNGLPEWITLKNRGTTVYNTVLSTIVTMLYITSPGLVYLITGSLYLLTTFAQTEILDLMQTANKNDKPHHPGLVIVTLRKSMDVI